MYSDVLSQLLETLDVRVKALAVCEIGADWRLRVDPFEMVVCHFVLRGAGFLEFGAARVPIAAGAIVIVPPGVAKSISGPERVNHEAAAVDVCTGYSDGLLAFPARDGEAALVIGCATISASCGGSVRLFANLREPMIAATDGNRLFAAGFDALLHELTEPNIGAAVVAECLMKQALVFVLREQMFGANAQRWLDYLGDPRIVRAAAAMIKTPGKAHSIEGLAELSGMSRSSFMSRFVQQYRKTPGEFLQGVRMHSAARLLTTSEMPVKSLAGAVGYSSRSQFSRAFKRAFGVDPSRYRNQQSGIEPSSTQSIGARDGAIGPQNAHQFAA